jgi:hypothetical protein
MPPPINGGTHRTLCRAARLPRDDFSAMAATEKITPPETSLWCTVSGWLYSFLL